MIFSIYLVGRQSPFPKTDFGHLSTETSGIVNGTPDREELRLAPSTKIFSQVNASKICRQSRRSYILSVLINCSICPIKDYSEMRPDSSLQIS